MNAVWTAPASSSVLVFKFAVWSALFSFLRVDDAAAFKSESFFKVSWSFCATCASLKASSMSFDVHLGTIGILLRHSFRIFVVILIFRVWRI